MKQTDTIERINILIEAEGLTRDKLSQKTGIGYNRWLSVIQRKTKLRHEELQALEAIWPEYGYWLAYGQELPEVGQISPMTKAAQVSLGTQRKAE